jgi:hypothetical protein
VSPSSASRERGNARISLSHPVGEGLGVRAKKHKHLVCVYGAVVYIYETAVYIYGAVVYIYETVGYIYGAVGYLYEIAGYIYGAIVEFLGARRSIHGVCAG